MMGKVRLTSLALHSARGLAVRLRLAGSETGMKSVRGKQVCVTQSAVHADLIAVRWSLEMDNV